MLEDRLVRGRELPQRSQNSLRHFVGRCLADAKHGRVFVHFARQPVGIDGERDRDCGHRARELAVDAGESREHVHAPQMHADAERVGVIDQSIRRRIGDLVLERRAKVSADRIAAVTIDKNAELGVRRVAGRSRLRGQENREDEKNQGEYSD